MQESSASQQSTEEKRSSPKGTKAPALVIAGRYEVVTKLAGGMAFVYLCRDHQTNQPVALKTFKPELLSHRAARDLFLREGTMWVELGHHPHIVRAFRVERIGDGREVYLVLEWVVQPKGKRTPALRSWLIPGRPLPVKQAVHFCLHVARGMRFATNKISGLIHRDLKPENILIGYDGRARVTDFGLASSLSGMDPQEASLQPTRENFGRTQLTHGVVGTPLYMAPEQWRHLPLDARADIYALGCILYEMVCGRFAAEGETREELKDVHLSGHIKTPPASVPHEVKMFLRRCLVADRNQRFGSWEEVENALATVYKSLTGEEPTPERSSTTETKAERLAAGFSYNEMGLSYLDIGKLDVSVMYFEQAVGMGRAEGSVELEGQGLGNLGLAYMALGYIKRAIEFHQEHLSIAHETGNQAEECRALGNLGRAYRRLGDAQKAVGLHERELAIARELGDRYREAAALDSLGDTYWELDDEERAVSFYRESLAIARSIEDLVRVKSILNSMGRVYLASSEHKEALALFQQSLEIARDMGDHVGEAEALGDLGELHQSLDDIGRATELYQRALKISQESNDRRKESENLTRLGDLYLAQGELEEAREYYLRALSAVQEFGDASGELRALEKLGEVHSAFGDYMQAASHFRRMLEMARDMGAISIQQEALLHLGRAMKAYGDSRGAIDYYRQHLALSRETGDLKSEVRMMKAMATIFREMQDLKSADKMLAEYLAVARASGNHRYLGDAMNQLGDVARENADPLEALEYYKAALSLAQEKKAPLAEATALGNMSMAYNEMGKRWQANRSGEKALKVTLRVGDARGVAWARYKLALVYFSQKRWEKADSQARHAQRLFAHLGEEGLAGRMELMRRKIGQLK
jgi:serine/threonine protein kinase